MNFHRLFIWWTIPLLFAVGGYLLYDEYTDREAARDSGWSTGGNYTPVDGAAP